MGPNKEGWVEVICGCMFSGKTEELIRRMRRVVLARQDVLLVKPSIDDRYSKDEVVSHSDFRMPAVNVQPDQSGKILDYWVERGSPGTVGIDEGQFFTDLLPVVKSLTGRGVRVLIAGLDLDYEGKPFLSPSLLSIAEDVSKLTAVCMVCGAPASRTQRLTGVRDLIDVGASESYEARCRNHWSAPNQ